METNTLCNSCTCGADVCSFMAYFVPVPGWEAEKVVYENPGREPSYTYFVKKCPLYVEMQDEVKTRKRKGTADSTFTERKRKIKAACEYGVWHFCDGTPNVSYGIKRVRPPCQYYKGGKCTKEDVQA